MIQWYVLINQSCFYFQRYDELFASECWPTPFFSSLSLEYPSFSDRRDVLPPVAAAKQSLPNGETSGVDSYRWGSFVLMFMCA